MPGADDQPYSSRPGDGTSPTPRPCLPTDLQALIDDAQRREQTENEVWDTWAEPYDNSFLGKGVPDAAVSRLTELATDGRALELGIGTGRLAIPLARAGIAVDGIELSASMAKQLKEKSTGLPITVTVGNMADYHDTGHTYSLIYAAYSVLHLLQSQAEQLRCLQNVARALQPGGTFVVEATHPQVFAGLLRGKNLKIRDLTDDVLSVSATVVDTAQQTVKFQEISIRDGEIRMMPCHVRWIWPAELDLMAALATLSLESRAEDWFGSALTPSSTQHVSLYRKA
ncbi:class I SAM-dependent DNA methyltransferase [Streptomyces sp. NPDC056337]|uniref:class I SAM-dependent DNA methyltransferase n=1 Tax=Streptomyces sp. NPDC056337 TaxID=3345787 RepID=UPI0035DB8CFE